MSLDITVYSEYEYGVASLKGAWFVQWTTSRLERVEGHTTEGTDKQTKIGLPSYWGVRGTARRQKEAACFQFESVVGFYSVLVPKCIEAALAGWVAVCLEEPSPQRGPSSNCLTMNIPPWR